MKWKQILSALALMLGGGYLNATAQVRVLVEPVPRAVAPSALPRIVLAPGRIHNSDSVVNKLLRSSASEEAPLWSERSMAIAKPCHGRFELDGFQREFDRKAMFLGPYVSPSKGALHAEHGSVFPLGAPTFYGLRLSFNFGRSRPSPKGN